MVTKQFGVQRGRKALGKKLAAESFRFTAAPLPACVLLFRARLRSHFFVFLRQAFLGRLFSRRLRASGAFLSPWAFCLPWKPVRFFSRFAFRGL
jgi:hypothetical protein